MKKKQRLALRAIKVKHDGQLGYRRQYGYPMVVRLENDEEEATSGFTSDQDAAALIDPSNHSSPGTSGGCTSSSDDNDTEDEDIRQGLVHLPFIQRHRNTSSASSTLTSNEDLDNYVVFHADGETNGQTGDIDQVPEPNPLLRMLPEEYQTTDVRKFFPDFKKNEAVRFHRLFGPGKSSSLPQIWRGARNYRKPKRKLAKQFSDPLSEPVASTSKVDNNSVMINTTVQLELPPSQNTSVVIPSDEFHLSFAPTPPKDECEVDDEMLLRKPSDFLENRNKQRWTKSERTKLQSNVAPWRYGPAAYWYDLLGVPPSGEGFTYGFKLKEKKDGDVEHMADKNRAPSPPSAAFYVTKWENEIIWDAKDAAEIVAKKYEDNSQPLCGWIPTETIRTYEQFMASLKSGEFVDQFRPPNQRRHRPNLLSTGSVPPQIPPLLPPGKDPDSSFCIFPPDNMELIHSRWEDEIIWDADAVDEIPEPKLATYDLTDPDVVYVLPEDKPPPGSSSYTGGGGMTVEEDDAHSGLNSSPNKGESRKDHHFTKKSEAIVGRVASQVEEDDDLGTSGAGRTPGSHLGEYDPFNLSNDQYYMPKTATNLNVIRGSMIQHSTPAQNLVTNLFPTHLTVFKLRHFHRLPLKQFKKGPLALKKTVAVNSLVDHIENKQKERDQKRKEMGGGEIFWMRTIEDLNARDGEIVFFEYNEEHPPLIQQGGMASKIRNYYKRKPGKDVAEPNFEYGETAYTHHLPFLGGLSPGESMQSFENNLFRAPIYQHHMSESDFLIIRSREKYFIRCVNSVFVVGQECPQFEVPAPNSKRATNFVRDFLLVFIYRLFHRSSDNPKRLRMEDVRRAFPHYAESSIRKRLKMCADFKRLGTGSESSYWVLREDFKLPSQEELRASVSPELCCAYYSMVAAEQRLKDAGYGEKYFFAIEDDEGQDEQQPMKIEDEVKCAPWNTTRAFLSAIKGKCLLELTGTADPTGTGEGFSYVRVSAKPPKDEQQPPPVKRTVTGTDADLRKLQLKQAKELLRGFGVNEDEIKGLSRWEIIDVIRTLSTKHAQAGDKGITKFARGTNKLNLSEMQQRYKEDCQKIFDLQNRVLSNMEELSSDEDVSDEDSDVDDMVKNVESMFRQQNASEHIVDKEEQDRLDLQRWIRGEIPNPTDNPVASVQKDSIEGGITKKLKIYRTYKNETNEEYTTEEVVTNQEVIRAYLKVREEHDNQWIRHFVSYSQEYKEEKRRERRRLQDRLRRLKKNEQRVSLGGSKRPPTGRPPGSGAMKAASQKKLLSSEQRPSPPKPLKPPKPKFKPSLTMKCSVCGAVGHMKTNKNCPMYNQSSLPPTQVAITDEQMEAELAQLNQKEGGGSLISVEGTKLKVSRAVIDNTEKVRRKSLLLRFPKHVVRPTVPPLKLKRAMLSGGSGGSTSGGSVKAPQTPSSSEGDRSPLKMNLSRLKMNRIPKIGAKKNKLMNSPPTGITMSQYQRKKLAMQQQAAITASLQQTQQSDYLRRPSQGQTHRRRTDPKVVLAAIFDDIVTYLKSLNGIEPFLQPVSRKQFPDYLQVIQKPMDLSQIRMNIAHHDYGTRQAFLEDVKQIWDNSIKYNGPDALTTVASKGLFERAAIKIQDVENKIMRLEKAINPLLDSDETAFSHILSGIVDKLRCVPKSYSFHQPVDSKKYPGYYEKIKRPMHLGIIEDNIKKRFYSNVDDFHQDIYQIYQNSYDFNGDEEKSLMFTAKAKEMIDLANQLIAEHQPHLNNLAASIKNVKNRPAISPGISSGDEPVADDYPDVFSTPYKNSQPNNGTSIDEIIANVAAGFAKEEEEAAKFAAESQMASTSSALPPSASMFIEDPSEGEASLLADDLAMSDGEVSSSNDSVRETKGHQHKSIKQSSSQYLHDVMSPHRFDFSHIQSESVVQQDELLSQNAQASLEASEMAMEGELQTDLACSDSDDEPANKRLREVIDSEDYDYANF